MPNEKPVTVTTTHERLDALRQHLSHDYLGHTKQQELVRQLLVDIDRAVPPVQTKPFSVLK